MPLPLHYMFVTLPGGIHTHTHTHTHMHTHKESTDTMNHGSWAALTLCWNLLPSEMWWHLIASFFSPTQWWADGGASEAPLRRHLYRQLQPLPQTDGRQEVPELSLNRKEKVGVSPPCLHLSLPVILSAQYVTSWLTGSTSTHRQTLAEATYGHMSDITIWF